MHAHENDNRLHNDKVHNTGHDDIDDTTSATTSNNNTSSKPTTAKTRPQQWQRRKRRITHSISKEHDVPQTNARTASNDEHNDDTRVNAGKRRLERVKDDDYIEQDTRRERKQRRALRQAHQETMFESGQSTRANPRTADSRSRKLHLLGAHAQSSARITGRIVERELRAGLPTSEHSEPTETDNVGEIKERARSDRGNKTTRRRRQARRRPHSQRQRR